MILLYVTILKCNRRVLLMYIKDYIYQELFPGNVPSLFSKNYLLIYKNYLLIYKLIFHIYPELRIKQIK